MGCTRHQYCVDSCCAVHQGGARSLARCLGHCLLPLPCLHDSSCAWEREFYIQWQMRRNWCTAHPGKRHHSVPCENGMSRTLDWLVAFENWGVLASVNSEQVSHSDQHEHLPRAGLRSKRSLQQGSQDAGCANNLRDRGIRCPRPRSSVESASSSFQGESG